MKLFLTSRIISGFMTCDVYDDTGLLLYVAREQSILKECLEIYDSENIFLGSIKESMPETDQIFWIYGREKLLGKAKKESSYWKLHFVSDSADWRVESTACNGRYTVFNENRKPLMDLTVRGSDFRTYTLELEEDDNLLSCVMSVLVIELSARYKDRG